MRSQRPTHLPSRLVLHQGPGVWGDSLEDDPVCAWGPPGPPGREQLAPANPQLQRINESDSAQPTCITAAHPSFGKEGGWLDHW